jgi:hypothetical protein
MSVIDSIGAPASPPEHRPSAPPPKPPEEKQQPLQPDTVARADAPPQPSMLDAFVAHNGGPAGVGSDALKGIAAGDHTGWFPQGPLPPNASMTDSHGYTYKSDMFGRPVSASGNLKSNPNPSGTRDSAARQAQASAGGADRLTTDEGGHGLGNRFFGRSDAWNLTPQDKNLNHSAYRTMENGWAKALDKGHSVQAETRAVYDKPTLRPTSYISTSSTNGDAPTLRAMENKANAGFTSSAANFGKDEAFIKTMGRVSEGLEVAGKVAAPVAVAADAYRLGKAVQQDGGTIGKHTVETAGSVAGGWAGAAVGAEGGAEAGAAVGALFGGVGAVPGAIVGGVAGGIAGGLAGSELGTDTVQLAEKAGGAISSAAKSVVGWFSK